MSIGKRAVAEFIGTFWLVFAGVGSAVLAAAFPDVGIGILGVAFAFGLALLTMAYAIGSISGCHVNPAVTLGLFAARRIPGRDVLPYIVAQVLGAIAGSAVLYAIASQGPNFSIANGFGANGYGTHSPGSYSIIAAIVAETVLTFMFLFVIVAVTSKPELAGFAPIAIGLTLTAVHLVGIPVTNMSVNPARSTGPAIFVGGWALAQLWLFWLFPIIGGVLGGLVYRLMAGREEEELREETHRQETA